MKIKKITTKEISRKKGHSIMKEKYYTPFFQTIYVFHFLFVLNDLKSYGCEI
jgi:hypothetical protein